MTCIICGDVVCCGTRNASSHHGLCIEHYNQLCNGGTISGATVDTYRSWQRSGFQEESLREAFMDAAEASWSFVVTPPPRVERRIAHGCGYFIEPCGHGHECRFCCACTINRSRGENLVSEWKTAEQAYDDSSCKKCRKRFIKCACVIY